MKPRSKALISRVIVAARFLGWVASGSPGMSRFAKCKVVLFLLASTAEILNVMKIRVIHMALSKLPSQYDLWVTSKGEKLLLTVRFRLQTKTEVGYEKTLVLEKPKACKFYSIGFQ